MQSRVNDDSIGIQQLADNPDRLIDWHIPYEPGTLRAVASENDQVVASHELETAGAPSKLELSADRDTITADGHDVAYVTATVVDDGGVRVPRADHSITFDVSGTGTLLGVDNGDLDSTESYRGHTCSAYHGTCIAVIQAGRRHGEVDVSAQADDAGTDSVTIGVE